MCQYIAPLCHVPISSCPVLCSNIWLSSTMCQYLAVLYYVPILCCPLICANSWLSCTMCQHSACIEAHQDLLQSASLYRIKKLGGRSCTIHVIIFISVYWKLIILFFPSWPSVFTVTQNIQYWPREYTVVKYIP